LERKGQIIGENDIQIAAHAISQGLILVSNKVKEFNRVPSLALENWVES
jgi:tRNA(fMet)-specific endonuclease VapC